MFKKLIKRAETVIEAIPYIQKFRGKYIVIKYGGSAMEKRELREKVVQDLILLKYVGINPVVVHGGGKHISERLKNENLPSEFIDGLRVSYPESMAAIRDVLINDVAAHLVELIRERGGDAIALSKRRRKLISAKKLWLKKNGKRIDLKNTGEVTSVNADEIMATSKRGHIPIISSIAVGRNDEFYNVNADSVAAAVAIALEADKLILLTDVNGVSDCNGNLISQLNEKKVRSLLRNKTIHGGMIPKIKCCLEVVKEGVQKTHILNGKIPHALLLELFTDHGIGSMVEK